jgi:pyrimidine and pyridine-specific 5'-nucleotidase
MCLLQIFTNTDKVHAEKVLRRLGLVDCFEGVICFETLNPPATPSNVVLSSEPSSVFGDLNWSDAIPKSHILCKPTIESMEAAIQIANVDPEKTVWPTSHVTWPRRRFNGNYSHSF